MKPCCKIKYTETILSIGRPVEGHIRLIYYHFSYTIHGHTIYYFPSVAIIRFISEPMSVQSVCACVRCVAHSCIVLVSCLGQNKKLFLCPPRPTQLYAKILGRFIVLFF